MKFAGITFAGRESGPSSSFAIGRRLMLIAGLSGVAMSAPMAHAAGTVAGTDIVNTAQASYDGPGGTVTIDNGPDGFRWHFEFPFRHPNDDAEMRPETIAMACSLAELAESDTAAESSAPL